LKSSREDKDSDFIIHVMLYILIQISRVFIISRDREVLNHITREHSDMQSSTNITDLNGKLDSVITATITTTGEK
jgi:hypothetical protein